MTEAAESFPDSLDEGSPSAEDAGIGASLRRAREARGLSVNDVVQALKFNPRQIEALEADDIETLPGAVFVRGMVRSYARFLKIAPDPLLARVADRAPVIAPEVRPPDNMGNAMPSTGARQIPLLVALSILLLVFAATLIVWHWLGEGRTKESAIAASVRGELRQADSGTVAATVAPESASPMQLVTSPPSTGEAATRVAPATEAPAAVSGRQLAFDFLGASWVEVKDATAQIIFTGQYGPGIRQVIAGQPPFQIVIGNAASVELRYDDTIVDLKPHTRAEVARLTLE